MATYARITFLCLGFGILAIILGTVANHPVVAAPGPTNVVVTNTPLPTSVTNFPATQSVSGTVNVGNFPATQSVNIANPQPQPIPTFDATIQPFATLVNPVLADGSIAGSASFTVPSGQRLIIEFIGGNVCLPVGQKAIFNVGVQVGTVESSYILPGTAQGTFNGFGGGPCDNFVVSQMVRIYADPNTTVTLSVVRSDAPGSTFAGLGVSGHLVNTQ